MYKSGIYNIERGQSSQCSVRTAFYRIIKDYVKSVGCVENLLYERRT